MSNRKLAWTDEAWKDYIYWQSQDKKTLKRINKLIKETKNNLWKALANQNPSKKIYPAFGHDVLMIPIVLSMLWMTTT